MLRHSALIVCSLICFVHINCLELTASAPTVPEIVVTPIFVDEKCKKVTCPEHKECFLGRCRNIDLCKNVVCKEGERCTRKGICQKQTVNPRKKICKSDDTLIRYFCSKDIVDTTDPKSTVQVCGFTKEKAFFEYENENTACKDEKIESYFLTKCQSAPKICKQTEECLNGKCIALLGEQAFKNNHLCNASSDCKPNQFCMAHKCIDKLDMFSYLSGKIK